MVAPDTLWMWTWPSCDRRRCLPSAGLRTTCSGPAGQNAHFRAEWRDNWASHAQSSGLADRPRDAPNWQFQTGWGRNRSLERRKSASATRMQSRRGSQFSRSCSGCLCAIGHIGTKITSRDYARLRAFRPRPAATFGSSKQVAPMAWCVIGVAFVGAGRGMR